MLLGWVAVWGGLGALSLGMEGWLEHLRRAEWRAITWGCAPVIVLGKGAKGYVGVALPQGRQILQGMGETVWRRYDAGPPVVWVYSLTAFVQGVWRGEPMVLELMGQSEQDLVGMNAVGEALWQWRDRLEGMAGKGQKGECFPDGAIRKWVRYVYRGWVRGDMRLLSPRRDQELPFRWPFEDWPTPWVFGEGEEEGLM